MNELRTFSNLKEQICVDCLISNGSNYHNHKLNEKEMQVIKKILFILQKCSVKVFVIVSFRVYSATSFYEQLQKKPIFVANGI